MQPIDLHLPLEDAMIADSYLAELEEPSLWGTTSECLVVFFARGIVAPGCLTDPRVVSFQPALGHWCLLGTDPETGRAFYTRFDHTAPLTCETSAAGLAEDEAGRH